MTNVWHTEAKSVTCHRKHFSLAKKKVKFCEISILRARLLMFPPIATQRNDAYLYIHLLRYIFTGEPITLKPDEYVYTFSCELPDDLPTSLQGTYGNIKYVAVVTISVPSTPDKTFEEDFTVIKPVNLNEMFELKVSHTHHGKCSRQWIKNIFLGFFSLFLSRNFPRQDSISVEKKKEFYICCLLFCFKTLPLYIVAKLPATGYTPGQRIELKLEIENQSSKAVEGFRIEFFKVIGTE